MSILQMKGGKSTGETARELEVRQLELPEVEPVEKAVYVKLTPGTPLFEKVQTVSGVLGTTMTQSARFMMRNGYLGFRRFLSDNLINEVEFEGND